MKKLFVSNLPTDFNEASLKTLFSEYGRVRSVDLATDIFSGKCKGFGFVEMEGHEARAAQAALDGKTLENSDRTLRVKFEDPKASRGRRRR